MNSATSFEVCYVSKSVSMISMVTSAPRLPGLLILPNKHCTYKNDLVLVTKPFYNCVKALFQVF